LTCAERKKQRYKNRLDNNTPFFIWTKAEQLAEISPYIVLFVLLYGIIGGQYLTDCGLLKEMCLNNGGENKT